ncbi:MAG: glutamine-hydrolyzing carbamoyl-phosphate synthase small subunit [Hyphomicrobiales bacterium]|nr:glutamine-hydrolyzing carbamoyl-phosphate synthase small subunit [Hyphomicrobiales bacterium]
MADRQEPAPWSPVTPTGVLVLADGTVIKGMGCGAQGHAVGEVCFNTAMTGYQEIMTDPSYAGQIVTFTFPHIGNVGTNEDDIEMLNAASRQGARGVIMHAAISAPANHRATRSLQAWLEARGIIGLSGVDTRALTTLIREKGMPNGVIAHARDGVFDLDALRAMAAQWPGIDGMDLVPDVTSLQRSDWHGGKWQVQGGYSAGEAAKFRVVAIDYGIKRNILRLLTANGCAVTIVPATTDADTILALKPDGVFLSNGPGDPAETGKYAVPVIQKLLAEKIPTFGICLGHQMMGLALGGRTIKMPQGHHGANHPVKEHATGKVEIVSMNHGFAVDALSLPAHVVETHVSLFDGSNCGLALKDAPAFSVQHHPEASPGPQDSHYLFDRFAAMMAANRA